MSIDWHRETTAQETPVFHEGGGLNAGLSSVNCRPEELIPLMQIGLLLIVKWPVRDELRYFVLPTQVDQQDETETVGLVE